MNEFGENLRRIRLEKGMSQDDLAHFLGTSKQVISRYETNQRSPKISVVADYSEKLGVSLSELTGNLLNDNTMQALHSIGEALSARPPKTPEARAVSGLIDDLPKWQRQTIETLVTNLVASFPKEDQERG